MPNVELIYDAECPNVEAAREQLRQAFRNIGLAPAWQEWDRESPTSPAHARQYGSPTILVDGRDVGGEAPRDSANCCRVYSSSETGLQRVPSVDAIATALSNSAANSGTGAGWRSWLAVLPAAGIALLPKITCPLCWPVYAGLLSSVGLGFLTQTVYLLPVTEAFLAVALAALGFRARQRRGWGPFAAGLVAATLVIGGKFVFDADSVLYAGIGLLIAASLWNTWPVRNRGRAAAATNQACCRPEKNVP